MFLLTGKWADAITIRKQEVPDYKREGGGYCEIQ